MTTFGRHGSYLSALIAAGIGLAIASPTQAQEIQAPPLSGPLIPFTLAPGQTLQGRYAVIPYKGPLNMQQLEQDSAAGATIPLWSKAIKVGTKTYTYQMVGKNPTIKQAVPSTPVKTILIPVKLTFTAFGNFVRDPTVADPACSPKGSALTLTQASPVLKPINLTVGGTALGHGQYVDLFQRAEFWNYTKPTGLNPGYHVTLSPVTTLPKISLTYGGGNVVQVTCGKVGLIDINTWDTYLQGTLFPALKAKGVNPTTIPIFLFYNVVLFDGNPNNCCILGYHGAFNNAGTFQTYSVSDYDSTKTFTGTGDISVLTHEVGEWMNDPSGTNPTPPWGHIGQVAGCQNNLEVGDPLSGTIKPVTLGTMTYHVQDLAFLSWFYQQATSIGVNKWYSLYGTFKTKAKPCA